MSVEPTKITSELRAYLLDKGVRESALLQKLRAEGNTMPEREMQIGPEQGQFMAVLIELMGARKIIEVGVFIGYGTLWMAGALPSGGKIIACDISERFTSIARRYWAEAGVSDRIDLKLAPAKDTLAGLIKDGAAGSFDLVFIDADKASYATYYEQALTLLRPGGVILIDNVLWDGKVIDAKDTSEDTNAIRALNDVVKNDQRVSISMIPLGDGLTIARKR